MPSSRTCLKPPFFWMVLSDCDCTFPLNPCCHGVCVPVNSSLIDISCCMITLADADFCSPPSLKASYWKPALYWKELCHRSLVYPQFMAQSRCSVTISTWISKCTLKPVNFFCEHLSEKCQQPLEIFTRMSRRKSYNNTHGQPHHLLRVGLPMFRLGH